MVNTNQLSAVRHGPQTPSHFEQVAARNGSRNLVIHSGRPRGCVPGVQGSGATRPACVQKAFRTWPAAVLPCCLTLDRCMTWTSRLHSTSANGVLEGYLICRVDRGAQLTRHCHTGTAGWAGSLAFLGSRVVFQDHQAAASPRRPPREACKGQRVEGERVLLPRLFRLQR